jgi:predicted ATPase/class 3 adenylate cyclase
VTTDSEVTLPTSGALTFLFTDIEGSTRKAHELGDDWFAVLEKHHALLRPVFAAHGGLEVSTAGDSFFVVFEDASAAIAATVAMQHTLAAHDWSPHAAVKVRMGLHTGPARFRPEDKDYAGLTVHAASRVESAAAGAQVLITEATLDAAREMFPDGVDVLDLGYHRLKDLPSEVRIYQLVAEGLPREFPPVRGLDVVRNNVPTPPSSFIGRTDALRRLHHQLEEGRLVTITGPGGTGKTRLALRVAAERLPRYADGVWFVGLATAASEDAVAAAVADALGVTEEREQSLLETTAAFVRDKNLLLVVDNCEHVLDEAAAVLERLLASGLGVRVLATSREPIEIEGERISPLEPLAIDDDDPAGSEAVVLLADRIALVRLDFELTADLVGPAVTIARRLDGLPLALELAAASAATLSLQEIADQLDERFQLLTRGKRTAVDRQKTLWGAIDWSYGLLDEDQRRLFRRLAVFPSEFDFGVVTALCGSVDEVERDLPVLIRKSLVTEAASTRLRCLESIRAYAREQLIESGEYEELAEKHARFFVASVAESGEIGRPEWVDTVNEDLLAAHRWGAEHDGELELCALVELQQFWMRRGRWTEGRTASEATLRSTEDLLIKPRWNALALAGQIALSQGDTVAARSFFEGAAEVAETVAGPETAQMVLGDLGELAARAGEFDTAEELYATSLEAARHVGNKHVVILCQTHLAQLASQRGDLAQAWDVGNQALDGARQLEWDELDLTLTNLLGVVAHHKGDLVEARRVFADALALTRKLERVSRLPYLLFCTANVELDAGEPTAAAPFLREAISLGRELRAEPDLVESLEASARVASALGERDVACELLATTDVVRERLQFIRDPSASATYERLRAELSDAESGSEPWPLERATEAALTFLDSV